MSPRPFRRDAGQLVFAGFAGPVDARDPRDRARDTLGGIVLFKRNVEEPAQVAELA
jgi:beta-glucosidase-like glycosyl hydrolase